MLGEVRIRRARDRPGVWLAEAPGQLLGRQPAGHLEDRERVAVGLGEDPFPDLLVQRSA